jgi:hypothetical protein
MPSFETTAGTLDVHSDADAFHPTFGYELWEGVVDPADPEGPRGLVMHIPANSMTTIWQLVQPDNHETVELLSGSASLVVYRAEEGIWRSTPLTPENPTGDGIEVGYNDMFCMVAGESEAWVLRRPSEDFVRWFEQDVTSDPKDKLSRYIANIVLHQRGLIGGQVVDAEPPQ